MARLTETSINAITPPRKGQLIVHDDEVTGFCVRVSPRGTRTFLWYGSFEGKPVRVTLGRYSRTSLEQARSDALEIRKGIEGGDHPAETHSLCEWGRETQERFMARLMAVADRLAAGQFGKLGDFHQALLAATDDAVGVTNSYHRTWLSSVAASYLKLASQASAGEVARAVALLSESLK